MKFDPTSIDTIAMLGALVVSVVILKFAPSLGEAFDILDYPDFFKKKHPRVTPLVGGFAIIIPTLLWVSAMMAWGHVAIDKIALVILLCGTGATLVGYADDQSATSPSSRLLSIFLFSAIALVVDPGLMLTQLHFGSLGILPLTPWLACALVAICMAGFVNAVNMADGQNGVAIGMFVIWSGCLAITTGGLSQGTALVLLETSLLGLFFNMTGRVFLGDSGSYGIAFLFGLLAINAHNRWGVSAPTIAVWFFVPVADCVRLMMVRLAQGRSATSGDRNHLHHRLKDRIGEVSGLAVYLGSVALTSAIASLMPAMSFDCLAVLFVMYCGIVKFCPATITKPNLAITSAEDDRVIEFAPVNPVQVQSKEKISGRR